MLLIPLEPQFLSREKFCKAKIMYLMFLTGVPHLFHAFLWYVFIISHTKFGDTLPQFLTLHFTYIYVTCSGKRYNSAQKFKTKLFIALHCALRAVYDDASRSIVAFSVLEL